MTSRAGLTRFMRILLTMGSGETAWLIVAFVCGAMALGVFANFLYDAVAHPTAASWPAVARTVLAVALLVVLAYLAYRRDLSEAWRAGRFITNIQEVTAPQRAGLIWLLSLGKLDLPLLAIRHHLGEKGEGPLRHCWVLVTPDVQREGAYERLEQRIEEMPCCAVPHRVPLEADTAEKAYQAIEHILTEAIRSPDINLQPQQVIADITGGTKAMTAGMVLACLPQGVQLQYVASQRDPQTGQYVDGTQRPVVVNLAFWRQR
jgi:hypothetical protein